MGCCEGRVQGGIIAEQCAATQKRLGLQDLNIRKFRQKLLSLTKEDQNLQLSEVGDLFKDFKFGKQILDPENSEIKQIMKNPVFLHHDGITFADLLSFAILYSKGDVGDKVEAMMWQLDDSNEKKVLITHLKQIITNMLTISAVIIPSVTMGVRYREAYNKQARNIQELKSEIFQNLFPENCTLEKRELEAKFDTELRYLLQSSKIRAQISIVHMKHKINQGVQEGFI